MADVNAVLDKWVRNTTNGATAYRQAIQALSVNPLERAASKADDWQARVSDPRTKEKFVAGLRRVSFDEWKRKAVEVGAGRIASGVQAASSTMRQFLSELLPYTEQLKERIRAMPKRNESEAMNRLLAAVEGMRNFRRRT
jgi:hypothetical protein